MAFVAWAPNFAKTSFNFLSTSSFVCRVISTHRCFKTTSQCLLILKELRLDAASKIECLATPQTRQPQIYLVKGCQKLNMFGRRKCFVETCPQCNNDYVNKMSFHHRLHTHTHTHTHPWRAWPAKCMRWEVVMREVSMTTTRNHLYTKDIHTITQSESTHCYSIPPSPRKMFTSILTWCKRGWPPAKLIHYRGHAISPPLFERWCRHVGRSWRRVKMRRMGRRMEVRRMRLGREVNWRMGVTDMRNTRGWGFAFIWTVPETNIWQ